MKQNKRSSQSFQVLDLSAMRREPSGTNCRSVRHEHADRDPVGRGVKAAVGEIVADDVAVADVPSWLKEY